MSFQTFSIENFLYPRYNAWNTSSIASINPWWPLNLGVIKIQYFWRCNKSIQDTGTTDGLNIIYLNL